MMRASGYVQMFEMAAPVEPAMAWPRAGRAGPPRIDVDLSGASWILWYRSKASSESNVSYNYL